MTINIQALLKQLEKLETQLYQQDFLHTWKQSDNDLKAVLLAAEIMEALYRADKDTRVFKTGLAVSIFRDKSTRTRFSFASAASLMGLSLMDLDETKTQVAHGETVRETANMISFLTEVIGIRDDMFIGEGHAYMTEVSQALTEGFEAGVLPQRPAVINLQCDQDHPTQTLADLMHLQKTFGSLDALQGKKIAMTWAYSPSYGKPLSVPQGIIALMTRFGMHVTLGHPEGYELLPGMTNMATQHAQKSGGSFSVTPSMDEAFENADIVYPKSWAPFKVMEKRTEFLRAGETDKLNQLEKECIEQNNTHMDWECNEERMAKTREGKALYMHCLPADITGVSCNKGEVSSGVFDSYRWPTYREAEHKPYVMAAMMLLTRFKNPEIHLSRILNNELNKRN